MKHLKGHLYLNLHPKQKHIWHICYGSFDAQTIGVQFPAGIEDFSSFKNDQSGSEAHPGSYQKGTNCCFTGSKEVSV
jgi:hypothetical protein